MWTWGNLRSCHRIDRFSYSAKESGSSVIFVKFYTRSPIEWRQSFYHYCAHSKILQNGGSIGILELYLLKSVLLKLGVGKEQLNNRRHCTVVRS